MSQSESSEQGVTINKKFGLAHFPTNYALCVRSG